MKLQILQETLTKALSVASRFANTKAQLPVLGNILLSTRKTKLLIASTNLEVSFSTHLSAKIEEEGEITVPGRSFNEIIGNLTSGNISLEVSKEQLQIKKESFRTRLSGMNASDFPKVVESLPKDASYKTSSANFTKGLSKVLFATSNDITRPILTGVLIIFNSSEVILVGTDGFRLSQKKIKETLGIKDKFLIVPKTSLSEAVKLFESGEDLFISFDEAQKQVLFGNEESVLASSLIEGTFPDFEKIIPKKSKYQVLLDREDFLRAIKLSGVIARDSANIIKIRLGKDSVSIVSESANSGDQENSVEAKVEGDLEDLSETLEISFNFKFIEEFLSVISSTSVILGLTDSNSPGVFLDPDDPEFLHLIMPIKIT